MGWFDHSTPGINFHLAARSRIGSAPHALERVAAGGPFHAVAEEGVYFRKIAQVIGSAPNIPVVAKSPGGNQALGWFARFANLDVPPASERTRLLVG